jgi:cysteine-rich secretory family protein/MORN repeat protein
MKHVLCAVGLLLLAGAPPQDSQQKEFYASGKLKAEFGVDAEGRHQGRYVEYYESGKKRISGNFDKGERHGEWWEYYESGKIAGKKRFEKGRPAGAILRMDENGIVLYRATVSQGQLQVYRDFRKCEPACSRSMEEIRREIEKIDPKDKRFDVDAVGKYEVEPSAAAPYRAGKLKAAYLEDALKHFNVYRYLSGVNAGVKLDEGYNELCQHAAVVVAATGKLSHTPARSENMDASFYSKGSKGASSNLSRGVSTLRKAIDGWMEDSGENNLKHAGHRSWCQNPEMGRTGFGDCTGFHAQWAHDKSGRQDHPDLLGYPVPGYHPVEYFGRNGPWSIAPKEGRFRMPGSDDLVVRMWVLDGGFDFAQELEINSKTVTSEYGTGLRAVFRPTLPGDLELKDKGVYVLILKGAIPTFGYTVHFASLETPTSADSEPSSDQSKRIGG